jgi:phosphoribosylformylglycinamidine (FGAM) synthase-like enzyme
VRFVWSNAHRFSLAHDISDGGIALALEEAAAWSGVEAELASAVGPGVLVAVAPGEAIDWPDTVELGSV